MTDYYIFDGNRRVGPYDMVAIIRKIRNYSVFRETPLYRDFDEEAQPAVRMPEFYDVFNELEQEPTLSDKRELPRLTFPATLKSGYEFLKLNTFSTVLTGLMLLVFLVSVAVFSKVIGGIPLGIIVSTFGYFAFVIYLLCIHRKSRMQLLTREFYHITFRKCGLRLLVVATITAATVFYLPIFIGAFAGPAVEYFLILIPGTFILTFLFFAPLLIVDRGMKPIPALKASIHNLRSLGFDNTLVIYLLILLNFSPLVIITLPITLGALCEIYDTHFNEY